MRLRQLSVSHFRNIEQATLANLADVNFVHGLNGSGKTSLLEALHTLSISHSFRTRKIKSVIQAEQNALLVRGELGGLGGSDSQDAHWLAVQRSVSDGTLVKFRGQRLRSVGEMAGILPVQLVNPAAFALVEGSPADRRQFLDWSVFHVKHLHFYSLWIRYRKALQQRNSLLRRGKIDRSLLAVWDRELVACGEKINESRRGQFDTLLALFSDVYAKLAPEFDERGGVFGGEVKLRFSSGWDAELSLAEALESSLDTDLVQGFTRPGPHRADLSVRVDGMPAADVLSRGQTKTLVCALKIAQLLMLEQAGVAGIVLIDDLPAELDVVRRRALFRALAPLKTQVFATSITKEELSAGWCAGKSVKRFHVEHGRFAEL